MDEKLRRDWRVSGAELRPVLPARMCGKERPTGAEKPCRQGTFDRPCKRAIGGLGYSPNKRIGNGKGYPDDLLAGSIIRISIYGTKMILF